MGNLMHLEGGVILHSAVSYPRSDAAAEALGLTGKRNAEMRAMTIAAFRVSQNNDQLSQVFMNGELLTFLLAGSSSALRHWIEVGRLTPVSTGYRLEVEGLAECQNTLLGRSGAYSTTEAKVQEWVNRLLDGDTVACRPKEFDETFWRITA